ncbi:hypothetical protein C8R46DRAFT_1213944 [Mycena filopes]|nr:hypothetical protein C8R46DRAFT_1213944 [Mycena filopes]
MLTASVRAASGHCGLVLNTVHRVQSEYDGPALKTRFPQDVDVVLASDLVFTLSGVLNGVQIAPDELLRSQLAQHLVHYFQANAKELGLVAVSSMYLADDGLPKLKVVSSRGGLGADSELRRVHVTLVGIELNYVWRTNSDSTSSSLVHPFSTHLSLPFKMLLDDVICRFFKWHLVRRYPLIFGPWCQLHIERLYFDKIFSSISGIIARSPNPSFRKKCNRMLQTIQESHCTSFTAAAASLATYLGSSEDSHEMDQDSEHPALTDEEAFSLSMEIRYRTSLRRPLFKGTTQAHQADDGSDDDELSQDQALLTPESSQRFDEEYLWRNPVNDFEGLDLDLPLPWPSPNIDKCPAPGIAIEYQDPFEFWSDPDGVDNDADDLLNLFSDDEVDRFSQRDVHSQNPDTEVTEAEFSLVIPGSPLPGYRLPCELGLGWDDVNMDRAWDEGHAERSPDTPLLQTLPTRIECLSPPEEDDGEHPLHQGTTERYFPGLSRMHCQAADLELSFDSDSDHDLEEFEDVLHGTALLPTTCAVIPGGPEHQFGNGSAGVDEDGAEIDEDFCIGFLDEDW